MKQLKAVLLACLGTVTVSGPARADGPRPPAFVFPSAPLFSSVNGPVLPGPSAAGVVNASALANHKGSSLAFFNSAPLEVGDFGVHTAFSHTGKTWGFSAGYAGTVGAASSHGYFAASAIRIDQIALGAGVSKDPRDPASTPSADLSLTLPMLKQMLFTTVFRNLAKAPQPSFGVGFRGEVSQYELFLELPPLNDVAAGYLAGTAITWALGAYSLYGAYALQTVDSTSFYTFGIGRWFGSDVHISIQYDSTRRINAGVTLSL